ncbi:MAG: hypothetical protein ACKORM_09390, partial [Solirubrobacterales bacterium]
VPDDGSVLPGEGSPFATTPVAPSAALLEASSAGPSPSAGLAILIGLGTAALVAGAVTVLARRGRW